MVREKETSDVYALKILRKEEARKRVANGAEDERDVLANATGPWIPKLQYAFQVCKMLLAFNFVKFIECINMSYIFDAC